MGAKLLEGEQVAVKLREELKADLEELKSKGKVPHLVAVQVGENAASRVYVRQQAKSCEDAGIRYTLKELPDTMTQDELGEAIEGFNSDDDITGIILQMPVPEQIDARTVQQRISPAKDVEGMNPFNMGTLFYGSTDIAPCTAMAAVELLKSSGIDLKGKEITVVGHSEIVGKPIAMLLLQSLTEASTVTVCHIATKDLAFHTKRSDVVIVAAGKAGLIKADMLSEGAIVVDVGINRVLVLDKEGNKVLNDKGKPKRKTVGDVDFEAAKEKCSMITPVPGGVGVLTVVMLLRNTVRCLKLQCAT